MVLRVCGPVLGEYGFNAFWILEFCDSSIVHQVTTYSKRKMPYETTLELPWTADLATDTAFTDRQIVIQILEDDYSFTDDDYGLAYRSQPLLESPIVPAQTLEHVPIAEPTPNTKLLVVNMPPSSKNLLPSSLPVRLKPAPIQSSISSNNESHSGSSRTSSHGSVVPTVGASGVKFVIPPARRKAREKTEFADHLIHHPLPQSIGFYPTGLPY